MRAKIRLLSSIAIRRAIFDDFHFLNRGSCVGYDMDTWCVSRRSTRQHCDALVSAIWCIPLEVGRIWSNCHRTDGEGSCSGPAIPCAAVGQPADEEGDRGEENGRTHMISVTSCCAPCVNSPCIVSTDFQTAAKADQAAWRRRTYRPNPATLMPTRARVIGSGMTPSSGMGPVPVTVN